MKSIKISEDQLKRMRTQLTDQLKDVLGKVEFIQGFLEMLGASPSAPAKRGRKPKTAVKPAAKKRGRPAKKTDAASTAAKKTAAKPAARKRGRPAKAAADATPAKGKSTAKKSAAAAPAKRGRKPKAVSSKTAAAKPKKRGRKKVKPAERNSKWGGFILATLKKDRSLYTTNKLIEQAVKQYNLNDKEAASVKTAISASLFRLMNVNKKVAAYKVPGRKGKYYGLTNWFEGAEIKKMYRGRLVH